MAKAKTVKFSFADVKAAVESRATEQSALKTLLKVLELIGWSGTYEVFQGSDGSGTVRSYVFHKVGGAKALVLTAGPSVKPLLAVAASPKELPKGVYIQASEAAPKYRERVKVAAKAERAPRSRKQEPAVRAAVAREVARAIETEAVLHEAPPARYGADYEPAQVHYGSGHTYRTSDPYPHERPTPPAKAMSSDKAKRLAAFAALMGS